MTVHGDRNLASQARRRFLGKLVGAAGSVSLLGIGLGLYSREARSLPAQALRPPGVDSEQAFLAACIRCGLCVRDCPYGTLKLADIGSDVSAGTPYFEARKVACEMCEDIPCVKACPTGALNPALQRIDDARMGLAVLIDEENCIAFRGLRCEVCFNVCPVSSKAITLEMEHNQRSGMHARFIPVIHSEHCTGCGKCENACILHESAVKVLPHHLAQGSPGEHYRLGWEEKSKSGHSLVTPDSEHRYNLPEGMRYDHQGEGLIIQPEGSQTPFSTNPLETLKRGMQEKL